MTWNGEPIEDVSSWMALMAPHQPGEVVRVGVDRDGERIELMVKLFPRVEDPE